ncbi:MAG: sodium/solute symporter [Planctomycetota bacterium]|nr:sodium/solute symporter [Planctomycetota bacterium]
MHPLDHIVVAVYLLVTLGLGVYFGRHQSRREFFAAGGSMGWMVVGLSVMATLFSSNSFVMYPSAAFGSSLRVGLALVAFTAMSPLVVWVFIPVYSRLACSTAYDYLEKRFHVSVRCLASGLFILLRIGWMASATYAASFVIASIAEIPQVAVILSLGVVAIAYTMMGGLRAVMWTDVIQFFIFATTILLALGLLVSRSGLGIGEITTTYFEGRSNLMFDFTPSMALNFGSWAILIGSFLEALSAFGADQVAVQRYISARSVRTSQIGFGINLLGMWIVIPGLLAIGVGLFAYYEHHPQELLPILEQSKLAVPDGITLDQVGAAVRSANLSDKALPQFVRLHFPPGMVGLFLAALMAAVMSSIDSGIHSVTTAVIIDFRDRLRPAWRPQDGARDVTLIRCLVVIIGGLSITLACFVGELGGVFEIAKKTTAAFGGPLLAVFILALFFRRASTPGAFIGALLGAATTMLLMKRNGDWFSMWFWPIGFGLTMIIGLLTSLVWQIERDRQRTPLTFWEVMRRDAEPDTTYGASDEVS